MPAGPATAPPSPPQRSPTLPESPQVDHPHHGFGPMAAIAGGGALGTLARYGISRAVVTGATGLPWATLIVNVVGSFVLGLVVTLIVGRWPHDRWFRPLVAVGFCGGFTTFSTVAVEVDQRVRHGHAATAMVYLVVSVGAGLVAALAGATLARTPGGVLHDDGVGLPDPDLLAGDDPAEGTR